MQMAWFSDPRASVRAGAPGSPVSAALPVEASRGLKLVGGGAMAMGSKSESQAKLKSPLASKNPPAI